LSLVGVFFSSLSGLIENPTAGGIPPTTNSTAAAISAQGVPFIGVSFQALAATFFATPVLLLFVYDKNNGVLEYLLSLGMDQRDIFREYLKAALILAALLVTLDVMVDLSVGVIVGTEGTMLEISGLVVVVGLSAVSLGTMLMMSFSSLQKQRVGSNQPLGMAIGTFSILPSYFLPIALPTLAFSVDLILAGVIVVLALLTFSLSSRLISREKFLP